MYKKPRIENINGDNWKLKF